MSFFDGHESIVKSSYVYIVLILDYSSPFIIKKIFDTEEKARECYFDRLRGFSLYKKVLHSTNIETVTEFYEYDGYFFKGKKIGEVSFLKLKVYHGR